MTVSLLHLPNNPGACRYHGYFALVSSHEKDCFEALKKYRKREKVEEYFQMAKEDADASKTRVWYADHLMGRMMVQFIALAYEDYLRYRIGKMKAELLGIKKKISAYSTEIFLKLMTLVHTLTGRSQ